MDPILHPHYSSLHIQFRLFWSSKFTLAKFLFLMNRYLPFITGTYLIVGEKYHLHLTAVA